MPNIYFWSSSTYVNSSSDAWFVTFRNGNVGHVNKLYDGYYVMCVRDSHSL
ncbi:hypothetical protein J5834_02630 [bacterium]|nr:hypothetical protein [bacterium]